MQLHLKKSSKLDFRQSEPRVWEKTWSTWVWAAKKWQQAGQSCMSHVTQAAGHCGVSAFLAWRSSASPARAPVTSKHEPPEWEGVVTWTWGRALTLSTRPGIGSKCKWPAKLCRRDRCSLKFCTPCSCSEHLGILGCRYLIFLEKLGHKDVDSNERDRGRDRNGVRDLKAANIICSQTVS